MLVDLKILKIYIKINIANSFIKHFKFSLIISNFFVKKFNKNFYLYVNYSDLNNLIIKNSYLLQLIDKFLDWPKKVKYLT